MALISTNGLNKYLSILSTIDGILTALEKMPEGIDVKNDAINPFQLLIEILKRCHVTEDEIISMVNEGQEQGVLASNEAEMISNIIEFDEKEVKDIMTHRKKIVAIDGNQTVENTLRFMLDKNYDHKLVEEGKALYVIAQDSVFVHNHNPEESANEEVNKSFQFLVFTLLFHFR